MSKKNLNKNLRSLEEARNHAAVKLQHLCYDAAHGDKTAFMNRDRAMDVVDAIAAVVLETLNQYLAEEKDAAAAN